jgi:hypothetical protein
VERSPAQRPTVPPNAGRFLCRVASARSFRSTNSFEHGSVGRYCYYPPGPEPPAQVRRTMGFSSVLSRRSTTLVVPDETCMLYFFVRREGGRLLEPNLTRARGQAQRLVQVGEFLIGELRTTT